MSTAPVDTTYAEPGAVIHYATVFDGGKTPVLCRSTAMNRPASDDPRYVECPACFALMRPAQQAMRVEQERRYGPAAA